MDSGACDLSAGIEARDVRAGFKVGDDASARIVLGGDDRDPLFFEVDAESPEFFPDGREFVMEEFAVEVGAVEIDAPSVELLDFALDGAGDDVAGGEFEAVVVVVHEPSAEVVPEGCARSSEGFGEEEPF